MNLLCFISLPARHYWVDRLDPWIIRFSDNVGIRWYGLAYLLGIVLAGFVFARWARQGRLPIRPDEVTELIYYAALGVIVGGRLGYCLFYDAHYVFHHPAEIFEVWHGGMASHGGILGLVLALWIFARRRGLSGWIFWDAAAVIGPLGIAFGRVANFVNGELWGRPTAVPWAVVFPRAPLIDGVEVPRHPSELYAAGIEGVLVFVVARWIFYRQSRAGITTAVVCITYGVGRFIDEFWREPDFGQPLYFGWMSKGQLLTIPMILIGFVLAVWRSRIAPVARDACDAALESRSGDNR